MAEALAVPGERPARGQNIHEMIEALCDQYNALEASLLEIEKQQNEIQDELDRLKDDVPSTEQKIIVFVEELEKAREYLKFTSYLRERHDITHDSDEILTFKGLVQHERVQEKYTKLDFEDIMNAVQDHILDLQMQNIGEDYRDTCGDQIRKNPIINLVYRILEEGYVMNREPLVELDTIEKSHPLFYQNCFIRRVIEKHSEKMVVVRNVPITYQEIELMTVFSDCGEIESVRFERDGQLHKIAYVTFGNSEGAKLAPILMVHGENYFSIRPVVEARECESPTISEVRLAREKYIRFLRSSQSGTASSEEEET